MENSPIQANELKRVYTALISPMYDDGRLDIGKFDRLLTIQKEAGIEGVVVGGTTGQGSTLRFNELIELSNKSLEHFDRVIVGAGSNSTTKAVENSQRIEEVIGPTTFLHATGYYNKPSQEGVRKHFETIADSLDPGKESNIILYHVPSRGCVIEPETALQLSQHERIIGIKYAEEDFDKIGTIIEGSDSESFRLLSGEDYMVADVVGMGGYGVISASANIAPAAFVEIVSCAFRRKSSHASACQEFIKSIVDAVFCVSNPVPLAHMFNTNVRSPLVELDKMKDFGKYDAQIRSALKKGGIDNSIF